MGSDLMQPPFLSCWDHYDPLHYRTSLFISPVSSRLKGPCRNLPPCSNSYMLRGKLESNIDSLIGEKLPDPTFLAKVLRDYQQRLATSSSQGSPEG
jgi:hypothetical protein